MRSSRSLILGLIVLLAIAATSALPAFAASVTGTSGVGLSGNGSTAVVQQAPVVSAGADQGVVDGAVVSISASFSDDSGDTHTGTIDWGDGSAIATATVDQGLNTVTGSHTFGSTGLFTVVVTVTDSTALSGTDTLMVTVISAPSGGALASATAVSMADLHTCALTTTGGVQCWGNNDSGRLGDGTSTDRWTPVGVTGLSSNIEVLTAGYTRTCVITTTGGLKCWGLNQYGELGDGTSTTRSSPVDVLGLTSGVAAVAPGYTHTCALTTAGGVKCWGKHQYGTLGDGTTTTANRSTPSDVLGLTSGVVAVAAGFQHTCAVTTAGGVKCWGRNH